MSPRILSRAVRQAADPNAVPTAFTAGRYPATTPVNSPYRPRPGRVWSTR